MANQPDISELIELLEHKSSPKRRSAAKKLRKLKSLNHSEADAVGEAIQRALETEILDERSWETQYQMIMALGASGYIESLDFLCRLADQEIQAGMVYVAIGDSVARLMLIETEQDTKPVVDLIDDNHPMFIDGVLRAIAMMQLKLSTEEVEKVLHYGATLDIEDNSRTWIAAAAAGWDSSAVKDFLEQSASADNQQTKRAVQASLAGKYLKWSPL